MVKTFFVNMYKNSTEALFMTMPKPRDFWFLLICFGIAYALFYPDMTNLQITKVVAGFVVAVAAITHVGRRLMLPYIDLSEFATAALEKGNMAAAVVFASVCALMISIIIAASAFFR